MPGSVKLTFTASVSSEQRDPFEVTVLGREAWALLSLMRAGKAGCTPITRPAPRWSDYVFKLRRHGVLVETIHEAHDGTFAGHHARYVLRDKVEIVKRGTLDAYLDSPEGRREFPGFIGRAAA